MDIKPVFALFMIAYLVCLNNAARLKDVPCWLRLCEGFCYTEHGEPGSCFPKFGITCRCLPDRMRNEAVKYFPAQTVQQKEKKELHLGSRNNDEKIRKRLTLSQTANIKVDLIANQVNDDKD